jgi:hypothetical protein
MIEKITFFPFLNETYDFNRFLFFYIRPTMAAAYNAMNECLERIGFNQPAVLFITSHGVTNAKVFRTILYQVMAQFVETIVATRVPPQAPPAQAVQGNQAAQAAAAPPQPVTMAYTALRGIKALRAWLDY